MTEGTKGSRPAAQYGEYASPEEQAKARGPVVPQAARPEPVRPAAPTPASASGWPVLASTPAKDGHPVDRIATIALLAFGLFVVLTAIPGYLALANTLQQVYTQLGKGTYTATELTGSLGVTAVVVQCALWTLTALFSTLRLRRGRLAWWIPVVGGIVAFISLMVIVSVALMADPGFVASLS